MFYLNKPIKEKLRKLGLPDSLFTADYDERNAAAEARYMRLLERVRELEAQPGWQNAGLPWEDDRLYFEGDLKDGEIPVTPIHPQQTMLQGHQMLWRRGVGEALRQLKWGFLARPDFTKRAKSQK